MEFCWRRWSLCHGGFQKPFHVSKSHFTLTHYDVWVPSIIIGWFSYIKRDQSTILISLLITPEGPSPHFSPTLTCTVLGTVVVKVLWKRQYWAMTGFAERFNTVNCLKSSLLTLKTLSKPGDCPSLGRGEEWGRRKWDCWRKDILLGIDCLL